MAAFFAATVELWAWQPEARAPLFRRLALRRPVSQGNDQAIRSTRFRPGKLGAVGDAVLLESAVLIGVTTGTFSDEAVKAVLSHVLQVLLETSPPLRDRTRWLHVPTATTPRPLPMTRLLALVALLHCTLDAMSTVNTPARIARRGWRPQRTTDVRGRVWPPKLNLV